MDISGSIWEYSEVGNHWNCLGGEHLMMNTARQLTLRTREGRRQQEPLGCGASVVVEQGKELERKCQTAHLSSKCYLYHFLQVPISATPAFWT